MAVLTKQILLGATTPPQETVKVPELGGDVIVRGMSGSERDAFEASLIEGKGRKRDVNMKNLRAKLVAYCCVDEQGARIFNDSDAAALGEVRADVLNRIYTVAQRLSGISEEDAEELGQVSSPKDSASSSSGSPKK
jgi:hypothetical protein